MYFIYFLKKNTCPHQSSITLSHTVFFLFLQGGEEEKVENTILNASVKKNHPNALRKYKT